MKLPKFRVITIAAVFIVLAPAVALAISPFSDVIPGKFYVAPVEWALDNGITTGKTATTFEPDSPVTRGESVTFLKRYHDNIVKQSIGSLGCAANQVAHYDGTNRTCKSVDLIFQLDPAAVALNTNGDVGWHTSIAIGTDGKPVIAYYEFTNLDLRFAGAHGTVLGLAFN